MGFWHSSMFPFPPFISHNLPSIEEQNQKDNFDNAFSKDYKDNKKQKELTILVKNLKRFCDVCETNNVQVLKNTVGGIAQICFKQWFQITADAHPGVSGVSKDQKFCEKFKNTHCQVDHPAKIK